MREICINFLLKPLALSASHRVSERVRRENSIIEGILILKTALSYIALTCIDIMVKKVQEEIK